MVSAPVSSIRNLGPAADTAYARAGITDADQLRALGADAAYLAYLETGGVAHFIGYYTLVMGLQGRPWNDCTPDEKAALRLTFDALKSKAKVTADPQSDIEAILNTIGVGAAR